MTFWTTLDEIIDNQIGSAALCWGALVIVGLAYPPGWTFAVSAAVSYVAFDAVMSLLLRYGDGWVKVGLSNDFQTRGKAFFVFFCLIVGGTVGVDGLLEQLIPTTGGISGFALLYGSAMAVLLVLTESTIRFYGLTD